MAGEDLLSSPSDLKLTSRRGFAKLTLAGLLATTCQSALAESAKASSSENEGRIPPIQHSNKRFEFRLADGGEREAVPLGNGVVGTSLWISKAGYIEFYVARTDVFTEIDRNVHLGKVKIGITPNPFVDSDVTCCLNAETGHLEIDARGLRGQFVASVFVDKETGAIVVRMADRAALTFTVEPITWRLSAAAPQDDAVLPGMPEAQDVVTEFDGCIVVYHRNASSCVPQLAAIQVPNFEHTVPDPYVDRIFGFAIYSLTGELAKGGVLRFTKTGLSTIVVNTSSEQEPSLDAWLSKIVARAPSLSAIERMSKRTAEWWKFYWQQSWVNVGAQDLKGSIVAQEGRYQDKAKSEVVDHAYTFSKYMTACASGGRSPD